MTQREVAIFASPFGIPLVFVDELNDKARQEWEAQQEATARVEEWLKIRESHNDADPDLIYGLGTEDGPVYLTVGDLKALLAAARRTT